MRKKRIFAFVIDMVIINFFALIIDHLAKISFGPWAVYASALYMTMFLLKDSFGKPSIGHRLMKIKNSNNYTMSDKEISALFVKVFNCYVDNIELKKLILVDGDYGKDFKTFENKISM